MFWQKTPVFFLNFNRNLTKTIIIRSGKIVLKRMPIDPFFLIIVKMQNICNLIGWNSVHIFDILIAPVQILVECEMQEYRRDIANVWMCTNLKHSCICRYRINLHLIVLKLDSVSINKSIAPEFVIVKASQDLKLM